jgi:hypothetical protein
VSDVLRDVRASFGCTHLRSLGEGSPIVLPYSAVGDRVRYEAARWAWVGNRLSWGHQTYATDGADRNAKLKIEELLARTVLYKVGHHASHNATLAATRLGKYGASCEDIATSCASLKGTFRTSGEFHPRWGHRPAVHPPITRILPPGHLSLTGARVWQTHQMPINPDDPPFTPERFQLACDVFSECESAHCCLRTSTLLIN